MRWLCKNSVKAIFSFYADVTKNGTNIFNSVAFTFELPQKVRQNLLSGLVNGDKLDTKLREKGDSLWAEKVMTVNLRLLRKIHSPL